MMQESLTSKYNKLLSFRHKEVIMDQLEPSGSIYFSIFKDLCTQTAVTVTSSGPSFQVHRKVETLAVIDV